MNEIDIRKYANLMSELGLSGLEITEGVKTVRLERSVAPQREIVSHSVPSPSPTAAVSQNDGLSAVKSPIVGVFYAAPTENAEPYVTIGQQVKKGQTLCIIEAMKLMNEISAEEDGVIEKICVANGQVVEYGTELFRIKRLS